MNRIQHDADETKNDDGNKYKYEKVKNREMRQGQITALKKRNKKIDDGVKRRLLNDYLILKKETQKTIMGYSLIIF